MTTQLTNRKRSWTTIMARLMTALLVMAMAAIPAGVALAAPGDLDTTFDTDGKVTTFTGDYIGGHAVAIQPDGKIVVAGVFEAKFTLIRYNVDGSLDTSFDGDGIVITDLGGDDVGQAVAIQPDGKIVVAGTSGDDFVVVRYNGDDGSLDTTFHSDGIVITDFDGGADEGRSVAIQPDGKIIVAGVATVSGGSDFAVARYDIYGNLDNTFHSDGLATTDFDGGADEGSAVAIQPDGKIVVAGTSGDDFALVRYDVYGNSDNSFDGDGLVTTDFGGGADEGSAVAIQPDGKIVVAGTCGGDFALARYDVYGSLDTTFHSDGLVTTDFYGGADEGRSVAIQPDGKIIVAGEATISGYPDFAVARYDVHGNPDNTFHGDGKVTTGFDDSSYDRGRGVALQGNKIVVAGKSLDEDSYAESFALARYDGDNPPGTFVVNTTENESDGSCNDGDCSLQDAINLSNADPDPNLINFLIPGDWVHTIQPAPELPALTDDGTIIDGYSQPGTVEATDTTSATLQIEIDGSSAANNGFNIISADNVIKGLVINGFPLNGIAIGFSTATGNVVAGNHIGTDASGTTALSNTNDGVYIALGAKNNTVGGDEPADRNVISGNGWDGVGIHGINTMGNHIMGNYIGTDANGGGNLGNTLSGVRVYGGTHGNIIGGEGSGQGNRIAHNSRNGIRVEGTETIGNAIQRNSILANAELGIDLLDGTHGGILPPQILATNSGSVEVLGTACPGCTVEIFENSNTDGEGERYMGSATASESGAFTITVGSLSELYLTATATDAISGTSEFSAVFTATVPIYDHWLFLPLVVHSY